MLHSVVSPWYLFVRIIRPSTLLGRIASLLVKSTRPRVFILMYERPVLCSKFFPARSRCDEMCLSPNLFERLSSFRWSICSTHKVCFLGPICLLCNILIVFRPVGFICNVLLELRLDRTSFPAMTFSSDFVSVRTFVITCDRTPLPWSINVFHLSICSNYSTLL